MFVEKNKHILTRFHFPFHSFSAHTNPLNYLTVCTLFILLLPLCCILSRFRFVSIAWVSIIRKTVYSIFSSVQHNGTNMWVDRNTMTRRICSQCDDLIASVIFKNNIFAGTCEWIARHRNGREREKNSGERNNNAEMQSHLIDVWLVIGSNVCTCIKYSFGRILYANE